ncbi:MAG: hypothetical protein ABIO06_05080 [Pseudolysinimonas sp.]
MFPSIIATAVLLVGGFALALTPYVVFHSQQRGIYDGYHTAGPIVGLLALVPANIWALSVLWPRTIHKSLLVLALVALTAVAAGMLYWMFVVIYLSTVDWFVF